MAGISFSVKVTDANTGNEIQKIPIPNCKSQDEAYSKIEEIVNSNFGKQNNGDYIAEIVRDNYGGDGYSLLRHFSCRNLKITWEE